MRNTLSVLLTVVAVLFAASNTQVPIPPKGSPQDNQPVVTPVPPPASTTNQPIESPIPPKSSMTNQPIESPIPPKASMTSEPAGGPIPPQPGIDNQPIEIPLPPPPSMTNWPGTRPPRPSSAGISNSSSQLALQPRNDPPPPVPIAPVNHDTAVPLTPLLRVEPYGGPFVLYHFCIWQGPNKVAEQTTVLPFWFVRNGNSVLHSVNSYDWSCQVYTRGVWTDWFDRWGFTVTWPCPTPVPLTPANGIRVPGVTPFLSVRPGMLGRRYTFVITDVGTGRQLTHEARAPFWLVPNGAGMLEPGKTYDWSCRADEGTGWGNYFRPVWRFYTGNPGTDAQSAGEQLEFTCRAQPNPFDSRTALAYTLPRASDVTATFYTAGGRKVREFRLGHQSAGPHELVWNGTDEQNHPVTAGVYLYRLTVGKNEKVERLIRTQ
jgi:hypothetical protein